MAVITPQTFHSCNLRTGSRNIRLMECGLLQAVQETRRALRVGCGAKYGALVVLQDLY